MWSERHEIRVFNVVGVAGSGYRAYVYVFAAFVKIQVLVFHRRTDSVLRALIAVMLSRCELEASKGNKVPGVVAAAFLGYCAGVCCRGCGCYVYAACCLSGIP